MIVTGSEALPPTPVGVSIDLSGDSREQVYSSEIEVIRYALYCIVLEPQEPFPVIQHRSGSYFLNVSLWFFSVACVRHLKTVHDTIQENVTSA